MSEETVCGISMGIESQYGSVRWPEGGKSDEHKSPKLWCLFGEQLWFVIRRTPCSGVYSTVGSHPFASVSDTVVPIKLLAACLA